MFQQLEEFQVVVQKLGLLVNFKKFQACTAVQVQIIQCLGSVFNNRLGIIYPTQERFWKLMSHMHMICSQQVVTAQSISKCLGMMMMASFIDIIPLVGLYMRPIEFRFLSYGALTRTVCTRYCWYDLYMEW